MMKQRTSTYSKMYLVSPAIYERLLNCLDDSEKIQTESQNKPSDDQPPKRPSEQIIENIHLEEIGQPASLPPPQPQPNIYPDLTEEIHRENMGGTLYPALPIEEREYIPPVQANIGGALYPQLPTEELEYISPVQPMIEENVGEVYGPPTSTVPQPPWGEISAGPGRPMLEPPVVRKPKKSVRFGIPIAKFQEQVALKQRQRVQKVKPLKKYRYGTPIIQPLQLPIQPIQQPTQKPIQSVNPMPVQHIVTQEAYNREIAKQACGKNQLCNVKSQRIPKNVCQICGRAFGRSWNLSRHMTDVHKLSGDIEMADVPRSRRIRAPIERRYVGQFDGWHPPMALKNPYKRTVKRTGFVDNYPEKVLKLERDFDKWLDEPD